jgi:ribose transport system ATP-binding protein
MTKGASASRLLAMSAITKRFPGVIALEDVSLELFGGEVLALMGENGAGKSTLMKILGGADLPDHGRIDIDEKPVVLDSVRAASRLGIALIHQELMLAPNLDIAGNIFLGSETAVGPLGMLRRRELDLLAGALLDRVGLAVSPATPVSRLTAGQMQMVEIAKALSKKARIIIMDEPTSSLTMSESEHLFRIIRELKAGGIGIIYISHRMEEVMNLADRISVLRDGRHVGTLERAEATPDKIVAMMVGRELKNVYFPTRAAKPPQSAVFVVRDLVVPGTIHPVSFVAERGEILGFAGLIGSGRTELMETIFGVAPALSGSMTLAGKPYAPRRPRDAIDRGVYLAPEDRKKYGLVLQMTVAENISLPDVESYSRLKLLNRETERRVAAAEVARLRTRTPSIFQKVVNLSGGNQQKVVLGKWLAMNPLVLILDEPTRGIDVGAKAEIYRHMASLADDRGITILMVSSDMEEILGMSDRVVVMHERRVRGILPREGLTPQHIANLMTGRDAGGAAA